MKLASFRHQNGPHFGRVEDDEVVVLSLRAGAPAGNRLELQYDAFDRTEDLDAFFASGAYTENFMGVRFDPKEMIARFEAGDPIERITARPKLLPGGHALGHVRPVTLPS